MARSLGPDAQDILRAAHSMIANHGERAADVALARARNLGEGADEAREVWRQIFETLQTLPGSQTSMAV